LESENGKPLPEIMELKEPLNEMLITNLLGLANPTNGSRQRIDLPLASEILGPTKETSITLPHPAKGTLVLPKPLNARIIPQRIKGKKGEKEEALTGYMNALGISTTTVETSYDQVKYSLELPLLSAPLPEMDEKTYDTLKEKFPHQSDFLAPLLTFDAETEAFISSLNTLPPLEKIHRIEAYVRSHSFYDMHNSEVNGLKC
jgi:hypothetical protein